MKQIMLVFFLGFVVSSISNAQEYKKTLKSINKSLAPYYANPMENKAVLTTALADLEQVFKAEDAMADADAWLTKGLILNEISRNEMAKKQLDANFMFGSIDAPVMAYDAFKKAYSIAVKKSQSKDALTNLVETESNLNNMGIILFQGEDYKGAFKNFTKTIDIHNLLKENKLKSRLDDAAIYKDQTFYTGASAYLAGDKEAAVPFFESSLEAGSTFPLIFEGLFQHYIESNPDKAMTILDQGKKANPEDNSLLFAEINHYLSKGKLDVLTDKLKAAIAAEPDNLSVINTLGNVYDQLNQQERTAGNTAKADEYFDLAMTYFGQALQKDPNNFDAKYSQGALYYNKAASLTSKLNEVANDFSSAGTKKFNDIKAEMDGLFNKALPYFLDAEKLNGTDMNTMIALKEIYARTGDLEKSSTYKAKLEALNK
ncbi:MAG: hypothetical protein R2774_03605 [Saprospiraceae bacterium]